jgi:hypothetical protein
MEGPGPCFDNDIGTDFNPVPDIDHDIGTDHNLRDHDLNTDVDLALDHDTDFNPVHDFAIDLSGGRLAERKTIKAPAGDRCLGPSQPRDSTRTCNTFPSMTTGEQVVWT